MMTIAFTLAIHDGIAHAHDGKGKALCRCSAIALGHPRSESVATQAITDLSSVELCPDSRGILKKELQRMAAWSGPLPAIAAALHTIALQDAAFEQMG